MNAYYMAYLGRESQSGSDTATQEKLEIRRLSHGLQGYNGLRAIPHVSRKKMEVRADLIWRLVRLQGHETTGTKILS
jgi:hypothetical protein